MKFRAGGFGKEEALGPWIDKWEWQCVWGMSLVGLYVDESSNLVTVKGWFS